MNKKQLTERDICTKFITPALEQSGWDIATQIREEFPLTKGRIIVRGKLHTRAKHKRADYVLFYKPNIPIAIIEAKDNNHSLGDGMQQGLGYAEMLQVPFVFSSNGDGFLFHNKIAKDGVIERELALHDFPSAETLWQWWAEYKGLNQKQNELVTQDYYSDGSNKTPRYYQLLAINKTIEAIANGQNRILLVMATGTGKTFTAFQINLPCTDLGTAANTLAVLCTQQRWCWVSGYCLANAFQKPNAPSATANLGLCTKPLARMSANTSVQLASDSR